MYLVLRDSWPLQQALFNNKPSDLCTALEAAHARSCRFGCEHEGLSFIWTCRELRYLLRHGEDRFRQRVQQWDTMQDAT
jgi:hypothetical protein